MDKVPIVPNQSQYIPKIIFSQNFHSQSHNFHISISLFIETNNNFLIYIFFFFEITKYFCIPRGSRRFFYLKRLKFLYNFQLDNRQQNKQHGEPQQNWGQKQISTIFLSLVGKISPKFAGLLHLFNSPRKIDSGHGC